MTSSLRIASFVTGVAALACGTAAPSATPPRAARVAPEPSAPAENRHADRFVSFNVPNLHYIEDDFRFEARDRFRLPDAFEIADALESLRQLGGTVVRIYTLSVRKSSDPPGRVRHVLGPGVFDEAAFVALDNVLAAARTHGIRVIVPFVDNWQWWGGVAEYAAFRGKPRAAFWTDPELIADFEGTVAHVLARRNSVNGRLYREDDTIFAWETGNELEAPYAWTARIAAFIKQRDPTHAVIDGFHSDLVRDEAIADPNVDLLTSHHYTSADRTLSAIDSNVARIGGKKRYFIGEFGLLPLFDVERILRQVERRPDVLGALLWSLRFHRREGGFYWHWERDEYAAYHWPGFSSGERYQERAVLAAVRRAAFAVRGTAPPSRSKPKAPLLLPIASPQAISWQGSAGADGYALERAPAPNGPWQLVAEDVSDAATPYRALAGDASVGTGRLHYYRVLARNEAGSSEPSNVVGPVSATSAMWFDDLADGSRAAALSGVEFRSGDAARFKMDNSRAAGSDQSLLSYRAPGKIGTLRVYAYQWDPELRLTLEASADGTRFVPVPAGVTDYGRQDLIDAYHPLLYVAEGLNAVAVRFRLAPRTEIGRVELYYARY